MNKPTEIRTGASSPKHETNTPLETYPRGNRTSEVVLDSRIREVEKRLLSGAGYSELVVFCGGEFGVSENTAQRYIAEANQRIKAAHEKDRELEIAKAKARYEEIIRLAFEREELAVAVNAQRNLDRLLGLDAPERTEHRVTDTLTEFFLELRAGTAGSHPAPFNLGHRKLAGPSAYDSQT